MDPMLDERMPATETAVSATSRNLLQVFVQHRWLIVLGAVAGLVGGLLTYAQKQPVYQSNAQVLVVKKRADALPVSGGDPRMAYYDDYVATHLILIRSPIVVSRAVKILRDRKDLKSLENHSDPTGIILQGLTAGRDQTKDSTAPNNIINLSYKGTVAEDTGSILSAVIESYRDFLDETYRGVNNRTVYLIKQASEILQKDLEKKEEKYREFRKENPLLLKGLDGANIHLIRMKEFQNKKTGLLARSEELRERLHAIEKAKKEGKSSATLFALATRPLDNDGRQLVLEREQEAQIFPLLLRERALLQDYGDDHPEVIRVREQIGMTKEYYERLDQVYKKHDSGGKDAASKQIEARLESQVEALRQELALLETANRAMTGLLEVEEKEARKLESIEFQDEAFRTDIARTSKVLDETLKRLEEINLVQDGGFDARTITDPKTGYKVSPIAWQVIFSGFMLGLLAGVGGAYLLDLADKSFRTPEEIRRRLGLQIVGHIPYLAHSNDPVQVTDNRGKTLQVDASLCTFHRPNSIDAEAYRSVRTALYFSTQGERHKVIQVTSPNMSDGKTTLIANLAVAIAQSGRKVILVDADLRRPRIHRMFGLTARAGLAQLIDESAELPDVIQDSVVDNLSILPAGPRPSAPGELLTQQRLAEIFDLLRDQYEYVLVDTPPLLAVSDPCAVAPRVDGVLLTIRVSKNGRPAAERARDILNSLKVQVFGVVVNGIGKQGAMSGYGYEHYDYAYSYSAEYTSSETEDNGQLTGSPALLQGQGGQDERPR